MQSFPNLSRDTLSHLKPQRLGPFSFPPSQRNGLLDSATGTRSSDQRVNLRQSLGNLLDVSTLHYHEA